MPTHTTNLIPPMVQMYDKERVRQFIKIFKGFIFGSEEIVKEETIEKVLVLSIHSTRNPDEIYYNGERVTLTPCSNDTH